MGLKGQIELHKQIRNECRRREREREWEREREIGWLVVGTDDRRAVASTRVFRPSMSKVAGRFHSGDNAEIYSLPISHSASCRDPFRQIIHSEDVSKSIISQRRFVLMSRVATSCRYSRLSESPPSTGTLPTDKPVTILRLHSPPPSNILDWS